MILTIDGVDKTGKNMIHEYIAQLSNHKYVITDRGILTQLAYADKFNRHYEYDLNWFKNNVIIFLTADVADLKVRCFITREKPFDIEQDLLLFEKWKQRLIENEFIVLEYNTSEMTPYQVALDVIEKVSEIEISKRWRKIVGGNHEDV